MQAELRIVFLYTELAGYVRVCMQRLASKGVEVHVFAYPINAEAPFDFGDEIVDVNFYERGKYSDAALLLAVKKIDPDAIICSGWIDRGYIEVCKKLSGRCKTVIALDSKLEGGMKEKLSALRAKALYKSFFEKAWVPGSPQSAYARKMGFAEEEVFTGFYTADYVKLSIIQWRLPDEHFPKRFVYMGRYTEHKGVKELWEAFNNLHHEGWELHCAGQGPLYQNRDTSEGIVHHGFVQPKDFAAFAAAGGIFILPSHQEPWGVVVHEFASLGYPLICSTEVGAASEFVSDGTNGFLVKPKDVPSLQAAMKKLIELSDEKRFEMGMDSRALAVNVNVEFWVDTAMKILVE